MHTPVIERIRHYYQVPNGSIFMETIRPEDRMLTRRKTPRWNLDSSLINSHPQPQTNREDRSCQEN